jgi:GAF domain-containing protein
VATAGRSRTSVVINNVELSETFLPHPLLPDTRSELAVPLMARGQLVGVLDVQSNQANYFTEQTLTILETLGNQIGVAISNATLYQVSERTSRHDHALSAITQQLQGATNVDEVLQVAVRELGKALRVPHTAIQLDMTTNNEADVVNN